MATTFSTQDIVDVTKAAISQLIGKGYMDEADGELAALDDQLIVDLGEKLQRLRHDRGMTLEAVGNIVGVGKSTVRKWENGDIKNMGRDKIELLAKALGVTPGYLMGWEDEKDPDPDPRPRTMEGRRISAGVDTMPEDVRKSLEEFLRTTMPQYFHAKETDK